MLPWMFVLVGCWESEQREEQRAERVVVRMGDHAEESGRIREALIQGDLARAKKLATKIVDRPPVEGFPAEMIARDAVMRGGASGLAEAGDLTAAASAFGVMSGQCASCHLELMVNPQRATPPEPPEAAPGDVKAEMQRHAWAAEALWTAWVMRDDLLGARALHVLGEAADDRPADAPQAARELDAAAHALAKAFPTAQWEERGQLYGQMIVVCATCHLISEQAP